MKRGESRGGLLDGCGSPQTPGFLGGRSFMGTGKKTTFMITNNRPKGRAPVQPHARVRKPHRRLLGHAQGGLSIASWGGVRGPFR